MALLPGPLALVALGACRAATDSPAERAPAVAALAEVTPRPALVLATANGTVERRIVLAAATYRGTAVDSVPAWSGASQVDFVRWSPDGSAVAAVATWPVSGIHTARALVVDTTGLHGIVALGAMDLWGGDWSPDGRSLAYGVGDTLGRLQRYGIGVVDATSGASALLFTTDTLRGGPLTRFPVAPIPVAVRWGSGGEIWFAMRQNPDAPPAARLHAIYAVDVATRRVRRVRLVRDSVRGDAAEISRAGDYELVLRTAADDPAPPTWPDFRTLVRVDLATGGERILVDGPRIRWARLTARDDHLLVAVNGAADPRGVALAYRLLTPDGRAAEQVAGPVAPPPPVFVWGALPIDVR